MMNGQGTGGTEGTGGMEGTVTQGTGGLEGTVLKGGSASGWNGGFNPFFPANSAYPSYPLNDHMADPNNPTMVTNAGQPYMIRGGKRLGRRTRTRSNTRKQGKSKRRRQRGGTWATDLFFGNNNNVVYQSNTTPGAELQRAIFMQKGTDSSTFSQMGPSTHNRLYV